MEVLKIKNHNYFSILLKLTKKSFVEQKGLSNVVLVDVSVNLFDQLIHEKSNIPFYKKETNYYYFLFIRNERITSLSSPRDRYIRHIRDLLKYTDTLCVIYYQLVDWR